MSYVWLLTTDRRLSVPYFLRITEVILVANGTMTMEARRRRPIRFEVVTCDAEHSTHKRPSDVAPDYSGETYPERQTATLPRSDAR